MEVPKVDAEREIDVVMSAAEFFELVLSEATGTEVRDVVEDATRDVRKRHPKMSGMMMGYALGLAAGRREARKCR